MNACIVSNTILANGKKKIIHNLSIKWSFFLVGSLVIHTLVSIPHLAFYFFSCHHHCDHKYPYILKLGIEHIVSHGPYLSSPIKWRFGKHQVWQRNESIKYQHSCLARRENINFFFLKKVVFEILIIFNLSKVINNNLYSIK